MRRIRYAVASSLDGYIAGPNGEADWIIMDPEIDFGEIFHQFDTVLVGRRTFEPMARGGPGMGGGTKTIVFSRTLQPTEYPNVTIVPDRLEETIAALRKEPGKDIWLFGGGRLFHSLAQLGLVDSVEVAIIPVLLGGGIPLYPSPAGRIKLRLTKHRVYPTTGTVALEYAVDRTTESGRRKPARSKG
jgi:dihydrofolate reductase